MIPRDLSEPSSSRTLPRESAGNHAGVNASVPPTGMTIPHILRVLRARIGVVTGVTAAVLLATAYLVREEQPSYRATAVIRIADARRALTTGIEELEQPYERLASPLLSHIQLIRSRKLLGQVVDSVGLRLRPDFLNFSAQLLRNVRVDASVPNDSIHLTFSPTGVSARSSTDSAKAAFGEELRLGGLSFVVSEQPEATEATWVVQSREAAIEMVLDDLRVTPRTQTNVVDITYTAGRRVVAQHVSTAIAQGFQALSAASAREQSRRRRVFLEEQLHQSDSAFSQAQLALSSFRRGTAVYSSRTELEGAQREAMRLATERESLDGERRTYGQLLATLRDADDTRRRDGVRVAMSSPGITANPAVTQLSAQLLRYRAAYDSLTTGEWRSAATNPDVQRLRTLISGTEEQLIATMRGRVTALDAQIASLDVARSRNATTLRQMPGVESEEIRLSQQVESIQRTADRLREDYQRARMAEAVEVGPVEIVDLAALPSEPVSRSRGLKLTLGLILGLALAGALAFLLELRNTPIRRRDEVEHAFQLPSLGLIPRIEMNAAAPVETSSRKFARAFGGSFSFGSNTNGHGATAPEPDDRSLFAAREAYRILRTNLLFAGGPGQLRTVAVTSAAPGEGKTTVAVNLASAFAHAGVRVLLIDADLRHARVHRLFGLPRSPGLADLLDDPALDGVVRATSVPNLFVIPGGRTRTTDRDAVVENILRNALRTLCAQFDLVILDTPPVLALADASIISAVADTVLFVVRAGRTDRGVALQALQQLEAVGANVAGTVLNDPAGMLPEGLPYYSAYAPTAG